MPHLNKKKETCVSDSLGVAVNEDEVQSHGHEDNDNSYKKIIDT